MPDHAFLRGEQVVLHPLEREHIELLQRVRNEPGFREPLGFDRPWNRDRTETFFERVTADSDSLNLVVCTDETPIGAVNVFDMDGLDGTLSYWLLPEHQGKGHATAALALLVSHVFDEIGLHRLTAHVFETNGDSQRLLQRLGFVHEGTTRDARFTNGEYLDSEQYGLLASEWDGA